MSTLKHSPIPWRVSETTSEGRVVAVSIRDATGSYVAEVSNRFTMGERDANAALIVRAVNSREALVDALMDAVTTMPHGQHANTGRPCDADCRVAKARAALAKAGGK